MNKLICKDSTRVTTLSYDMITTDDGDICTEIKDYLIQKCNWCHIMPHITVKKIGVRPVVENDVDLPASTLWKKDISPDKAIHDFECACDAYNVIHSNDRPKLKMARGKAFAICNKEYDAIEIR